MAPRPVVVAASEHPVAVHAVAECAGALLESGVQSPDLLWLAVGHPFGGALEDIVDALERITAPATTVAVETDGILGGGRVMDGGPSLVVMAAQDRPCSATWLPPALPFTSATIARDDPYASVEGAMVAFADPTTVRPHELTPPRIGAERSPRAIACHLGERDAGASRMYLDGEEHREGSIVLGWPADSAVRCEIVHGTDAIAAPMQVTSCDELVLHELDGVPASSAMRAALEGVDDAVLASARDIGVVRAGRESLVGLAETAASSGSPPGALRTEEPLETGCWVQPALRSPESARRGLERAVAGGPDGVLCLLDRRRPGAVGDGSAGGRGDAAVMAELIGSRSAGLLVRGVFPGPPRSARGRRGVAALVLFE